MGGGGGLVHFQKLKTLPPFVARALNFCHPLKVCALKRGGAKFECAPKSAHSSKMGQHLNVHGKGVCIKYGRGGLKIRAKFAPYI